ncbi:MAG TPA: hypothetical protein VJ844_01180 [Mucilaginibacter sp.]|nr:hypothetical protein [Mucilaginibacter sp.]
MNRKLGIALTVIGAIMLIVSLVTYKKKEKVVDFGPLQVSAEKRQSLYWMMYPGGILFIGGIILLATSRKQN